ncbi:glycosyltransferase family 25 protein [Neisseria meningitidis]|nr:glycosyltransferase family 25 protein [Neisseria meningitidis]
MQNHVISLSSAAERRAHIAETFGSRGIPFQFFDALMPSERLEQAMAELVPGLSAHPYLSSVEKACFMSHAVLWKQALDEGLPYIAVFEDDVLLGEGAEKLRACLPAFGKRTLGDGGLYHFQKSDAVFPGQVCSPAV